MTSDYKKAITTVGFLYINKNDDATLWGSGRVFGLKAFLKINKYPKTAKSPTHWLILSNDLDKETIIYREYAKQQAEYDLIREQKSMITNEKEDEVIDDLLAGF